MSSSLLWKSDTRMFLPSDTRVRDTQSFPETRTWASLGRLRSKESFTSCSRLKEGCSGPNWWLLASLAINIKSAQHFSAESERKSGEEKESSTSRRSGLPSEQTSVRSAKLRYLLKQGEERKDLWYPARLGQNHVLPSNDNQRLFYFIFDQSHELQEFRFGRGLLQSKNLKQFHR